MTSKLRAAIAAVALTFACVLPATAGVYGDMSLGYVGEFPEEGANLSTWTTDRVRVGFQGPTSAIFGIMSKSGQTPGDIPPWLADMEGNIEFNFDGAEPGGEATPTLSLAYADLGLGDFNIQMGVMPQTFGRMNEENHDVWYHSGAAPLEASFLSENVNGFGGTWHSSLGNLEGRWWRGDDPAQPDWSMTAEVPVGPVMTAFGGYCHRNAGEGDGDTLRTFGPRPAYDTDLWVAGGELNLIDVVTFGGAYLRYADDGEAEVDMYSLEGSFMGLFGVTPSIRYDNMGEGPDGDITRWVVAGNMFFQGLEDFIQVSYIVDELSDVGKVDELKASVNVRM